MKDTMSSGVMNLWVSQLATALVPSAVTQLSSALRSASDGGACDAPS